MYVLVHLWAVLTCSNFDITYQTSCFDVGNHMYSIISLLVIKMCYLSYTYDLCRIKYSFILFCREINDKLRLGILKSLCVIINNNYVAIYIMQWLAILGYSQELNVSKY